MYTDIEEKTKSLKEKIAKEVFVSGDNEKIIGPNGEKQKWLFDFRKILFDPESLNTIAELFWDIYKDQYPFQIGGLETASIPIFSAIVTRSKDFGKPINGFFIRKERKSTGLQEIIEGKLNSYPVILIDDLINTGGSIKRQLSLMENEGVEVRSAFSILCFRDKEFYPFDISSLFSLKDFNIPLSEKKEKKKELQFEVLWHFKNENPNYFYTNPKSRPAYAFSGVCFGTDDKKFVALNSSSGKMKWEYKVGRTSKGKSIFSSPSIHKNIVYFGAYDGNVYALNTENGERIWKFTEADWVGSSPYVSPDLNSLFVGLEFGLLKQRGGIVSLDLESGKKKWQYTFKGLAHSSPAYSKKYNAVAIGSNDFNVYLLDAKNGKLKWSFKTGGEVKASFSIDEDRGRIVFGSHDGGFYVLNIEDGALIFKYQTDDIIYSTPLMYDGEVIFGSYDKYIYSLNLNSFKLSWKFDAGSKVSADPIVVDGRFYVGAHNGIFYVLNRGGENIGEFFAGERIVNAARYDEYKKRLYLPTFAGEIYCLKENDLTKPPKSA